MLFYYALAGCVAGFVPYSLMIWDYERRSTGDYVALSVLSLLMLLIASLFVVLGIRPIMIDEKGVTVPYAVLWKRTYPWSEIREAAQIWMIIMTTPGIELTNGKRIPLHNAQALIWKDRSTLDAVEIIQAGIRKYGSGVDSAKTNDTYGPGPG